MKFFSLSIAKKEAKSTSDQISCSQQQQQYKHK